MPLHNRLADRYRLVRKIGAGGMGTVWEAEDERLARRVAVKLVHVSDEGDGEVRFLREAQVVATLQHQSIVTVYDVLELDEGIALIMEYVEGQNLRERLRAGGRLPPDEALAMLWPVGAALDTAHAQGVVHRDVKPANILQGVRPLLPKFRPLAQRHWLALGGAGAEHDTPEPSGILPLTGDPTAEAARITRLIPSDHET